MKRCSTCGMEIHDQAVICPHCGCAQPEQAKKNRKKRTLCSTGLLLSSLSLVLINPLGALGITGIILSIIGLTECPKEDKKTRNQGIWGIIAGVASTIWFLASFFVFL